MSVYAVVEGQVNLSGTLHRGADVTFAITLPTGVDAADFDIALSDIYIQDGGSPQSGTFFSHRPTLSSDGTNVSITGMLDWNVGPGASYLTYKLAFSKEISPTVYTNYNSTWPT